MIGSGSDYYMHNTYVAVGSEHIYCWIRACLLLDLSISNLLLDLSISHIIPIHLLKQPDLTLTLLVSPTQKTPLFKQSVFIRISWTCSVRFDYSTRVVGYESRQQLYTNRLAYSSSTSGRYPSYRLRAPIRLSSVVPVYRLMRVFWSSRLSSLARQTAVVADDRSNRLRNVTVWTIDLAPPAVCRLCRQVVDRLTGRHGPLHAAAALDRSHSRHTDHGTWPLSSPATAGARPDQLEPLVAQTGAEKAPPRGRCARWCGMIYTSSEDMHAITAAHVSATIGGLDMTSSATMHCQSAQGTPT